MRRVVFHHQAGAIEIDPRAADAGLCLQPGKKLLAKPAIAKRWNMKPGAALHQMSDRTFHGVFDLAGRLF
jgi:hypothetical protein